MISCLHETGKELLFPMMLLPATIFLGMTTMQSYEDLKDSLVQFEESMGKAMFVSHHCCGVWLQLYKRCARTCSSKVSPRVRDAPLIAAMSRRLCWMCQVWFLHPGSCEPNNMLHISRSQVGGAKAAK